MNTSLILIGFLIILLCQDIVAVRAFRRSSREGLFCVLIPGYAVYYATRDETRQINPVIGWLAGFGILLLGLFG